MRKEKSIPTPVQSLGASAEGTSVNRKKNEAALSVPTYYADEDENESEAPVNQSEIEMTKTARSARP